MDARKDLKKDGSVDQARDESMQNQRNRYWRNYWLEKANKIYNGDVTQDGQFLTLTEELRKLKSHDHLCLIYESTEEWRTAIIPFIKIGLEKGERCIYVADTHAAHEICTYLDREGVDAKSFETTGQLLILNQKDAYTKGGCFDPDRMISLLTDETKKALASGYSALRVSDEMSWVLRGNPGSEKVIEYEAKLNNFLPKYPCLTICQYDRRKFSPEIIKAVIMTHPLVVLHGNIYSNFYYIPPEKFLSEERANYEVEQWLRNIKQGAERNEQLAHLATHDLLTDLPNRLLFSDRLRLALAHAERHQEKLAVMMLDLDNFKEVDDRLGHSVGDKVLQNVAHRLQASLRKSDTVARIGGDEFLITLSRIEKEEDVVKAAEKILLHIFTKPFEIEGHEIVATISIGFSIYPADASDVDTLLRYADIAMYQVKKCGRNNCQRYHSSMLPNKLLE